MTVIPPTPSQPCDPVAGAPQSVPEIPVDILPPDPAGTPGGEDSIVPTPRAGGQGRWLKQGTAKAKIRGRKTREEIINLHVFKGMPLKDVARQVGRHYRYVCLVWQGVVKECAGDDKLPEAHKAAVRAYCDRHLRKVIEESQGLIGEAAAYGAVVVAGVKQLAELHGLKAEEIAPEGMSLEQVGEQVRVVSPLLIDKIEKVRALSGVSAARAEAREAAESDETVKE